MNGLHTLRPRISLRVLLIVFTLVAVWLGFLVARARQQRAALDSLDAALVMWDYQLPDGNFNRWDVDAQPPYPEWLRRVTGNDMLGNVRGVAMVSPSNQTSLELLSALPEIELLNLTGSQLNDDQLLHVARLRKLKVLNLDMTTIGDRGVSHLAEMESLVVLSLVSTNVSDAGLVHFRGMKQLRKLDLEGTAVTDEGVAELTAILPDCEIWNGPHYMPQTNPNAVQQRQ